MPADPSIDIRIADLERAKAVKLAADEMRRHADLIAAARRARRQHIEIKFLESYWTPAPARRQAKAEDAALSAAGVQREQVDCMGVGK